MAADEKWYFTKEQLQDTPSRRCGFDADKELSYRQQAANFIQDMGQKLQVSQLCINTAIVYMHRFYMFHSFTHFPWNTIAAAAFFLAAKVEEQPRKLEHVIRIANICLHRDQPSSFDAKSEQYAQQSQELVFNENVLLQTLGFDVAIDHPHTHVVRCCHLVRASKDLAQTSYFMASNSLHLTTMCLQYKPTVVACFCIHLACKWSNWQIPKSNEGKDWFYYVDKSVTSELLEQLTIEFLKIYEKCPSRLKRKISAINQNHSLKDLHSIDTLHAASSNSPFDTDNRKFHDKDGNGPTFHSRSHHEPKPGLLATPDDSHKKSQRAHDPSSSQQAQQSGGQHQRPDYHRDREYREKKERERLEREKAAQHHGKSSSSGGAPLLGPGGTLPNAGKHMPPSGIPPNVKPSSAHHRPPPGVVDPTKKMHHRESMSHRGGGSDQSSSSSTQMSREMANGRDRDREREHQKRVEYMAQQQRSADLKMETEACGKIYDVIKQKVPPDAKMTVTNKYRRDVNDSVVNKYAKQQPGGSVSAANNSSSSSSSASTVIGDVLNSSKTVVPPSALSKSSMVASNQSDKNLYLNKQLINSTSQRHKSQSSFVDVPKSVPAPFNKTTDTRNGNHIAAPAPLLSTTTIQQQQTATIDTKLWQNSSSSATATITSSSSLTTTTTLTTPVSIPSVTDSQQLTNLNDISGLLSPPPPSLPKKTSSLFSPEKTPPQKKSWNVKTPPGTGKTQLPITTAAAASTIPPAVSPFGSPPPVPKVPTPTTTSLRRSRTTSSSSSEPELRPVVKKLDQISGFENIIRDSKMGIKLPKVPDIIQPICDRQNDTPLEQSISKELKPPDIIKPFNTSGTESGLISQSIVNGIETDPAVISTLLKEVAVPTTNHLVEDTKPIEVVATTAAAAAAVSSTTVVAAPTSVVESEKHKSEHHHHHKSEKKKKKDKHKHKDKEKNRDEKKKKHKDKERHKYKDKHHETPPEGEVPLKITISKDKLQPAVIEPLPPAATVINTGSGSLKVKISKDRIKSDVISEPVAPPPPAPSTLKIKISKDQIQYNSVVDSTNNSHNSRKRERDKSLQNTAQPTPAKTMKTTAAASSYNGGRDSSRQNGRSSYNKVTPLGEGDASQLRLAESKYHSKGASKAS